MHELTPSPFMIWRRPRKASAMRSSPGCRREPKALPCKFFYDARGSALFEQICEVPEYYLTRTEIAILERVCRRHRGADRAALPADRAWQRRQPQGAHPAARARTRRPPMSRSTFPASRCAKPRRNWRADFPQVAGRRGLRRLHPPVSAAAAARPGRQAGRVFPGIDDRQFRARGGRALPAALRRIARPRRRDADRRRSEEGRRRSWTPPITTAPARTPPSTSTCWSGSTASWTATSLSIASRMSRFTTKKRAGWSCI